MSIEFTARQIAVTDQYHATYVEGLDSLIADVRSDVVGRDERGEQVAESVAVPALAITLERLLKATPQGIEHASALLATAVYRIIAAEADTR